MSERAKGKNHPRPGTPPRVRRKKRPGRNRPAKGYDVGRREWTPKVAA